MTASTSYPSPPDYYRTTYAAWYVFFSRINDPFMRSLFFLINGGFGGARRWRQLIADWVDPRPGERVIDICCGTGTLTVLLAERLAGARSAAGTGKEAGVVAGDGLEIGVEAESGTAEVETAASSDTKGSPGQVVGLELSPDQLRVARKKPHPGKLTFLRGDAQQIPFPEGCFDRGVICGALHEMPAGVRHRVLAEARRILRPGGGMVFIEQHPHRNRLKRWIWDTLERLNPEYPTYRDLMRRGLIREIERGGFRIMRSEVIAGGFFQIVRGEKHGGSGSRP
jgi:ubiquinone/menaquinone biosynthesis C-methylase UbiE